MEKILIISGSVNAATALSAFIRDSFQCDVKAVETAYQARSIFRSETSTELVLINSPLADESGVDLAKYIIDNSAASCILIVKAELAEKYAERLEQYGIIVVSRPFNKNVLYQLIRTVDIAIRRAYKLYEENLRLEEQLSEVRTVDKAKFHLMQYKGMTEEEAHTYIEQYAMNKRRKKRIAALEIIDKLNEQYL